MSRDLGNHIVVDQFLSLSDAAKIAKGEARIVIDSMAYDRCDRAHARLQKVISENRLVYGLTTGFGPLANRLVDAKHGAELQQNLVYHLASGVGPAFDWSNGRAMVLARLMSILKGALGASVDAINALVVLLNSKLSPCVPSKGTVGASGDLTPLAHMVLCFQGIGDFQTRKATIIGGQPALRQLGLSPLHLERRDGLALVNGTSAMTGVALINADLTERAIAWSLVLTAAMAEVLGGRIEAWHAAFSSLRPHRRQAEVADCLCASVRDSERVTRQHLASRRMADVGQMTEAEAGQDAYTLRCAPQVIGAVWDTLDWHNQITLTELNAVTDNPIFPEGIEQVSALHGGNFMGQHVGLASDALGNGICVLAGLADSLRN